MIKERLSNLFTQAEFTIHTKCQKAQALFSLSIKLLGLVQLFHFLDKHLLTTKTLAKVPVITIDFKKPMFIFSDKNKIMLF